MDIFEKTFQWVMRNKKRQFLPHEVFLNSSIKQFEILVSAVTQRSYSVQASRDFVGVQDNIIFLPEKISIFPEAHLNHQFYKYLLLLSGAMDALRVRQIPILEDWLTERLPSFSRFRDQFRQLNWEVWLPQVSMNHRLATAQIAKKEESLNKKTEKEKTYSSPVTQVDLDKEKANPVTHSFEKLETADQYQGGRRFDSGDDELEEHSSALDEVNLSHLTSQGESAQSIFKSDDSLAFSIQTELSSVSPSKSVYFYPEWNAKAKSYAQKHCQLFEIHRPASEFSRVKKINLDLEEKKWRSRLNHILTRPLWVKRLKDGSELDIDEVVREQVLLKSMCSIDGRWYMERRPLFKDMAIQILFDQSMSSDSWVNNRRVIDIIIESLLRLSHLFDSVIDNIEIAGTWSETRHHCHYEIFKKFDESWKDARPRLTDITPAGYTRLGPAIRHATNKLKQRKEKSKLLIFITDGKPTDLDGYEGFYGIQDVKYAFLEAERLGILTYALTIDKQGKKYFSQMFNHFSILNKPEKISEMLVSKIAQMRFR